MSSNNTGPHATLSTDLPPDVLRNWHESFAAVRRAEQIQDQLPALDEQIAQAQARLAFLTNEHKRAGRDMTAAYKSAETTREMVELWCSKHGRQLPPEPELTDPAAAAGLVQQALPAAPVGERDAGAEPPLIPGVGVVGETATQTLVDQAGGGDADVLGAFQPAPQPGDTGSGDGRGEGRA